MDGVRKLEQEDIIKMLPLRLTLQKFDQKYMNPTKICIDEKALEERTQKYLQENLNKNIYMFGYFEKGELVSLCGFYIFQEFPTYTNPSGQTAHLASVYTKESYRRKGYQKEVFAYALNYAEKMGITKFELTSKNEVAIHMYKSFGFSGSSSYYRKNV